MLKVHRLHMISEKYYQMTSDPRIDGQEGCRQQTSATKLISKSLYSSYLYAFVTQLVSQDQESQKSIANCLSYFTKQKIVGWRSSQKLCSQRENKDQISRYFQTFYASYSSGYLSSYLPSQLNYNAAIIASYGSSQLPSQLAGASLSPEKLSKELH